MKRVKVYRPKIARVKKGKEIITVVQDKKATLIGERSIMDNTLTRFQGEDAEEFIIHQNLYMEEVKGGKPDDGGDGRNKTEAEIFQDKSRQELNQIAADLEIDNPESFQNKGEIVAAILGKRKSLKDGQ